MEPIGIQAKIAAFKRAYPEYDNSVMTLDSILRAMQEHGITVTPAEVEEAKRGSIFGSSFTPNGLETGWTVEITGGNKDLRKDIAVTHRIVGSLCGIPEKMCEELKIGDNIVQILTQKGLPVTTENIIQVLLDLGIIEEKKEPPRKPTESMARAYLAQYLLEQTNSIAEMFEQTANSDTSLWTMGTGILVELNDLYEMVAKAVNDLIGAPLLVENNNSRKDMRAKIYDLRQKCETLVKIAERDANDSKSGKNFEKSFKQAFGKDIEYDKIINYLETVQEYENAPDADKKNDKSEIYQKLLKAQEEFEATNPLNKISKEFANHSKFLNNTGGLVDLGINVALIYLSGGSAAIARSAGAAGNAARYTVGNIIKKSVSKGAKVSNDVKFVAQEIAGILSSATVNAIETSAFFNATKVIAAVEDGKVEAEEVAIVTESFKGLCDFTIVGGLLAGPLGIKTSELIGKMCNSERAISSTMKFAIEGKGSTLDKVLKALSEDSAAVSKIAEFGTSFSVNAGYMALSDGTSYGEALGNLAQMDAVSKIVVAMLGGKHVSFLTPQKVQQIKTEMAGYKVEFSIYKGKKVYVVTDKTGTKTRLANEQELFMFIVDKEVNILMEDPAVKNSVKEPIKETKSQEAKVSQTEAEPETEEFTVELAERPSTAYSDMKRKNLSVLDIMNSPELTPFERKIARETYNKLSDRGYKEYIDNNPEFLIDILEADILATCYENQNNLNLKKYSDLTNDQIEIMIYSYDQFKNDKVSMRTQDLVADRRNNQTPWEWFEYIDNPDKISDEASKSFGVRADIIKKYLGDARELRSFLDTQSTPVNTMVYREERFGVFKQIKVGNETLADIMADPARVDEALKILNNTEKPATVHYDNFIGTTLDENIMKPNDIYEVYLEIDLPKNSKAAYLDALGHDLADTEMCFDGEMEVLLQSNTDLVIKNARFENGKYFMEVTAKTPQENALHKLAPRIEQSAKDIRSHWLEEDGDGKTRQNNVEQALRDAGFDKVGYDMGSRIKGESSLRDKITNYLKKNPKATIEDAVSSVRDAFGARTKVASGNFANHPEVRALLKAGDIEGAKLRAAELQSEPTLDMLKALIEKQASGEGEFKMERIVNYVSEDGIPYFSERQLEDLSLFARKFGIEIGYVKRIPKDSPAYDRTQEPTTRSQPSGYTALQLNLRTKAGEVIEWQYRGDKVNTFAEGEHVPYDIRTGKNPGAGNPALEALYEPYKEMLSKEKMTEDMFGEYNRYLNDYYTHLRNLELGFESVEPKLSDYGKGHKFDDCLSAQSLMELHEKAEKIKKSGGK